MSAHRALMLMAVAPSILFLLGAAPVPAAALDMLCSTPAGNLTPSPDEDAIACFPSPDGRKQAVVHHGRIVVKTGSRVWRIGTTDYGHLAWNPASTGFVIDDSDGSGQTNLLSYVDVDRLPPRRITALRSSAIRAYSDRFRCVGPKFYAHAWFDRWEHDGRIRLRVVEGVHSEGCRHPDLEEISIGVVGDPLTGRVDRVLTQTQLGATKSPQPRKTVP